MPHIIISNNGNQYFKKIIFKSRILDNAMCQNLMDGWKLVMSAWHYACSCNGVA